MIVKFSITSNTFVQSRIIFEPAQNNGQPHASNEKSIMMNALAQKYLPMEFQTNNVYSPNSSRPTAFNMTANDSNARDDTAKDLPTTDMSMTSYRYMEKYGLLGP